MHDNRDVSATQACLIVHYSTQGWFHAEWWALEMQLDEFVDLLMVCLQRCFDRTACVRKMITAPQHLCRIVIEFQHKQCHKIWNDVRENEMKEKLYLGSSPTRWHVPSIEFWLCWHCTINTISRPWLIEHLFRLCVYRQKYILHLS